MKKKHTILSWPLLNRTDFSGGGGVRNESDGGSDDRDWPWAGAGEARRRTLWGDAAKFNRGSHVAEFSDYYFKYLDIFNSFKLLFGDKLNNF